MWSRWFAGILLCAGAAVGQDEQVQPLPQWGFLQNPQVTVVEGVPREHVLLPARCDAAGRVYVRGVDPVQNTYGPILRIGSDGSLLERYEHRRGDVLPRGFAVDDSGSVYLLIYDRETGMEIIAFASNGSISRNIGLGKNIRAHDLHVFPSGDMLVIGTEKYRDDQELRERPYTVILDSEGRVRHRLTLASDSAPDAVNVESAIAFPSIEHGKSELADDGNVYLLRATAPPRIAVVSPSGETLRTLTITPPFEKGQAYQMKVRSGRIALVLATPEGVEDPKQSYSIYDAWTGDALAHYVPKGFVGGAMACYSAGDEFTFVAGNSRKQMVLLKVRPN